MISRSQSFKSAKLQKRRRTVVIGHIVFYALLLAGLWGFAFESLALPPINITEITVSGSLSLSPSEIVSVSEKLLSGRYFFTIPRTNIFFYPKARIQSTLLNLFPRLDTVSIHFKNFHAIHIFVTERFPEALWCHSGLTTLSGSMDGPCFFLDGTGFVFAPAPETSTTSSAFVKLYGILSEENPIGQTYGSAGELAKLLDFSKNLVSLDLRVSAFRVQSDNSIEALLNNGARLIFDRDDNLAVARINLESVISDPSFRAATRHARIDYIDLRFGNKVFYRLK